jgi:hypothetical protein
MAFIENSGSLLLFYNKKHQNFENPKNLRQKNFVPNKLKLKSEIYFIIK